MSHALDKYCELKALETSDEKFCYDTSNMRQSINRLMEMGADEYRLCQRVKSINSDFCRVKTKQVKVVTVHLNERLKRGIIYI